MLFFQKMLSRFLGKEERTRGVLSGSAFMAVSSIVSNLTRVGLIAILARVYTKDQFGIWVTITSATAVMATSDFGIGNALRNKLAELRTRGDISSNHEAREYFLSVIYFFLLLALVLSVCLLLFQDAIPYYKIFKTHDLVLKNEVVNILIAVQIIFLFGIPLGIGSSMFFAYMESFWVATFNIINGLVSVVVIGILAAMGKSITITAVVFFLISLLISSAGTFYFLSRRKWNMLQVNLKKMFHRVWSLLAMSIAFAVLQIAGAFIYNATTLVVTAKISLTDAAELNLVQKLYTFIIAVYLSLYNPLWAGYSDAIYRKDWAWAKRMLTRTMWSTVFLFGTALVIFSFAGNYFLGLLGGGSYFSQTAIFVLMGLWALCYSLYSMGAAFLSAAGKIKIITILTTVFALSFVSVATYFSKYWGVIGVSVWSALAFFLLSGAVYVHAYGIIKQGKINLVEFNRI